VRFGADIRAIARSLLKEAPESDSLLARLAEIERLVEDKASPEAVREACRAARDEAVARFRIPTMPTERPRLERAQELYLQGCAECHGPTGDGDTPRARTLEPAPARFKDPARLGDLSPYRVYNALTFGVPGTAMASFDALPAADRWSLAFYVFRLGHEGEPGRGPVAMSLADLAARTDREIRAELERGPFGGGLVHARREARSPSRPPASGSTARGRSSASRAPYAAGQGRGRRHGHRRLPAGFEPGPACAAATFRAPGRSRRPSATCAPQWRAEKAATWSGARPARSRAGSAASPERRPWSSPSWPPS
jgi:mono/diheme cytochrome c family protein